MAVRHVRKHWKKYLFGGVVGAFAGRWGTKRYRDTVVTRQLCDEAKGYGEDTLGLYDAPKKVYVFLNPTANNNGARYQFNKFAAPLLHLSGADVTVIESDYEGQARTLLGYIDPSTDAVIVAGGDGTLMEVVNGLLRRGDDMNVPIGIIPLGKENHFYWSHSSSHRFSTPARIIGDATMKIIRGNTRQVDVMQIQPERGKVMYALSGVEWGVFSNAERNKDSFRLFGRLRLFFSYLNTIARKWPSDYWLTIWLPDPSLSMSNKSDTTPITPTSQSVISAAASISAKSHQTVNRTSLAEGLTNWSQLKYESVGFRVSASDKQSTNLTLTMWTQRVNKSSFLSHGWKRCFSRTTQPAEGLPSDVYNYKELIVHPHPWTDSVWFTVDGEPFEALPVHITRLPCKINMFV